MFNIAFLIRLEDLTHFKTSNELFGDVDLTFDSGPANIMRITGSTRNALLDRFKASGVPFVGCFEGSGSDGCIQSPFFVVSDGNEAGEGPLSHHGLPFHEVTVEANEAGVVQSWRFEALPKETERCINLYFRVLHLMSKTPLDVWWW
jgi:hypothetical protein